MFVLDSNIAIAAMNAHDAVLQRFEAVPRSELGLPAVVVAELLYGAHRSQRRDENLGRVRTLREEIQTLWLDDEVLDLYASTRADLSRRGIPKAGFDLLIAATTLAADATLVTDDRALLDGSILGLRVENWLS